jgi:hypothetical protein
MGYPQDRKGKGSLGTRREEVLQNQIRMHSFLPRGIIMDPSVPSVLLPTQVACQKDQEPGQFKAYYQEMLDRSPLLPVGRGVEITAQNL